MSLQVSRRLLRDEQLKVDIMRVRGENFGVYGVVKVWRQIRHEGTAVARCRVARLMQERDLQGIRRPASREDHRQRGLLPRPGAVVARTFAAAALNRLPAVARTNVKTPGGWVYAAFVMDVASHRVGRWQLMSSLHSNLAVDLRQMALHSWRQTALAQLVSHSDRTVKS